MTVAFTYFFRDLQSLEMVRDHALPYLKTRRYINIWDAGCAMGPEPYTLAILLRESMRSMYFRNVRIQATDIDGSDLFVKIIQDGIYPWEQLERIPRPIFENYFVPAAKEGHFQIVDEIRRTVTFQKHSLLKLEPIGSDFSLIVCKNVLLHFTEEERVRVIQMFHGALMDGGFFVMEQTQKLPKELNRYFEPVVCNAQLYRKVSPEKEQIRVLGP